MTDLVLRGAAIMDELGGFTSPSDVHVRDGVVVATGSNIVAPAGAEQIDCADLWLMPGVFDCHTHVAWSSFNEHELLKTPLSYRNLETGVNARKTFEAGVTFVRDAGIADAGIRDAIRDGVIVGPRMQVSILPISQTGGHSDGFLIGPGFELSVEYGAPDYPGRPPFLVDGVDEMRKAVRLMIRSGADVIKICTTGGVFEGEAAVEICELSEDEVQTAVFEATKAKKFVMAHAIGGPGLDIALAAGVRSIEHGVLMTEQQAAAMAAAGTYLVPTLAIYQEVATFADNGTLPAAVASSAWALRERLGEAVRIAKAHGIPIALGSDFGSRDQHGRNLIEIDWLHQAGLTVEESLLAATSVGAELCGVSGRYGRIAPGHVFDALLLRRDPSNTSIFRDSDYAAAVFKGGLAHVVDSAEMAGR
ncbi:metal-dependent hydrolase family protein [Nakamurella antarctica]|nr:amidohydrolase family protein [Nakamurella antarctica]